MIREAIRSKAKIGGPVSSVTSMQSPVGGWNARDSIASMTVKEAIRMDNWYPGTTDVMLRKGFAKHVTGITGQVDTLIAWNGSGGTSKLFASTASAIYNVSAAGIVGAAVVSGLGSGRWQTTAISTGGSDYVVLANGADAVRAYDGTTWTSPAITGVSPSSLVHVCEWKKRLFFVETGTLSVWYLAVNSIAGAASELDFGPLFHKGGFIQAIAAWTLDAGEGLDDYLVIVTSEGEVAVYKGTDPSSITTFGLVGVLTLGEPLGRRCLVKFGGDLILLCQDGFVSMSSAIISERTRPTANLSNKILNAVSEAANAYSANFGWEGMLFAPGGFLIFNIPVQAGAQQQQYVMNTITGAWCKFTGWLANTFAQFNEELYFGGNGVVYKAWYGRQDDGAAITGSIKQAFNYFDTRGRLKQFKMMRPIFIATGTPTYLMSMNVDYQDVPPTGTLTVAATTASTWKPSGNAVWGKAKWGGALSARKVWAPASGIGMCGAPYLTVQANNIEVHWEATDVLYEPAGVM